MRVFLRTAFYINNVNIFTLKRRFPIYAFVVYTNTKTFLEYKTIETYLTMEYNFVSRKA